MLALLVAAGGVFNSASAPNKKKNKKKKKKKEGTGEGRKGPVELKTASAPLSYSAGMARSPGPYK